MDNKDIAAVLEEMATLMELKGENAFRCRAYANAARQVEMLQELVVELVERGELDSVRGIGKGLARDITELVQTGQMTAYGKLMEGIPEGLLEMLEVPGLGAKRVRTLHEALGISDVDALAKACEAGEVEKLSGFGKKTAERILQGVAYLQQHRGRYLYSTALAEAEAIRDYLLDRPGVIRLEVAGSIRRCKETTKDVDVLASSEDPAGLAEAFAGFGGVAQVTGKGETKVSVVLKSGMQADLRIVGDEDFPYTLHHFTGSREHNTLMRRRAKEQGMKLNEYGLYRGEDRVPCADEAALFKALGLAYIPPELREGLNEVEEAEKGDFPALVSVADLQGTLHVHTRYSDGRTDVGTMARAAAELGYRYIGICDHSRAAAYANGLTEERVRDQWAEIERVNKSLEDIRVLRGIEVDILGDGGLDFEDDFLAEFDLVVASVHSKFTMTEAEATERIVRAVENPHVDILGHPTGRLLLSREGYPLDVQAVVDAAAGAGTAIELNASPQRLDLDWRHLAYARERGVKISINTDAHSVEGLEHMPCGVGIARKGGLTAEHVLNAMGVEVLLAHFAKGGRKITAGRG